MRDLRTGARPFIAALEELRTLAEDLTPGAIARLATPEADEAVVVAALAAGEVVRDENGLSYAAPFYVDDRPAAVLVLDAPPAADPLAIRRVLQRLMRIADGLAPSPEEDPTQAA